MYICIDFDGTIVDHVYPLVGREVPNAISSLKELERQGCKLILFTMRFGSTLDDATRWLRNKGIYLYGINHNPDQDSWSCSPKAYGQIYIDDAAIGCPLIHPKTFARPCVDWNKVLPMVVNIINGLT